MQLAYGAGTLWVTNNVANPTPVRIGVSQGTSIEFAANTTPLMGDKQLPITVARGGLRVQCKSTYARFNGRLISELMLGGSSASGQILAVDGESGTIPGTPYAVTVANSSTWTTDLGVYFSATGLPLVRVAATPATGQYSVAAGVYTFAAADTSLGVKISYIWTTTGGSVVTVPNVAMGVANTFKSVLSVLYDSKKATFTLNSCVANKSAFQTTLEDFTKPTFDFEAFPDTSEILGTFSFAEVN